MPSTINTFPDFTDINNDEHRIAFKNTRGQLNHYALGNVFDGVNYNFSLFKSSDGVTWSSAGTIRAYATNILQTASLTFFEDAANSRTVVCVTWWDASGAVENIFVEAWPIADSGTNLGSRLWTATLETDEGRVPVVEIGRRSGREYLWVVYKFTVTSKGNKGNTLHNVVAKCTTTTFPVTTPTFSARQTIFTNPTHLNQTWPTIAPLSSTHDMLIAWTEGTDNKISGIEYSWNGSAFSSGTSNSATYTATSTDMSALIVDSSNVGHVVYLSGSTDVLHRKWTVGAGWSSPTTVYSSTETINGLNISVDLTSSPNKILVTYSRTPTDGVVYYKTSPVDTISFSAEQSVTDDTALLIDFSNYYQDWAGDHNIGVTYTRNVSPTLHRFVLISLAAAAAEEGYAFML